MKYIEPMIYQQEETGFIEGVEWVAGWYFNDETEDLHGPFNTIEETRTNLERYCENL